MFACFVCDVLCDAVWFVVCSVLVCVGALFISMCDVVMMNGRMLSGVVLCCCVFARVGFTVCVL